MNIVEKKDAGEATDPKEPKLDDDGNAIVEEPKEPNSDPLDAIEDEELRNDMKRLRAIDQRAKKKAKEAEAPQPKEEEEETPPASNYATKDDLKLLATNDAKKMVAPEVKELWDELTKIPLGGYDPLDSESIAENMKKRYNLYLIENPADGDDPTKDLTTSPNTPPSSKGNDPKPKKKVSKDPPGYKEPVSPEDWYPEKES